MQLYSAVSKACSTPTDWSDYWSLSNEFRQFEGNMSTGGAGSNVDAQISQMQTWEVTAFDPEPYDPALAIARGQERAAERRAKQKPSK